MEQQMLSEGTIVGKRFKIEALAGKGDLGHVYKAHDTTIEKLVALRVIPASLLPDEADIERVRERVREASTLTHRNIRGTFGMGQREDGATYIATEWIEGQNLRALLSKRSESGKRFSFKGAYNIMGHVCNALIYAHKKTLHGALCPRAIMVTSAGRVKVSDWGLSVIRTSLDTYPGREKIESTFWAPEVIKGKDAPDSGADLYSLGALFYELITGVAPERPLRAPSVFGFTKEVDAVIARCMAADPTQRYKEATAMKSALADLVQNYRAEQDESKIDDNMEIDVEIDLTDIGTAPKPDASASGQSAANVNGPASSMLNAPGLPPPPKENTARISDDLTPNSDRMSQIDMGQLISSLGKSESAHWMVQKDKFDHGPFTDRELVQMMLRGEVVSNHLLLNMDDGVRKKVKAWGHFDDYLERYRIKKKQQDEQQALQRTEKAEKRGSAFQIVVALGVVAVIGLLVGGYFLTRTLRAEKTYTPDEMIAALDSGKIKLKTGGNLISKKRKRGKGRRRGKGGGGAGGQFVDGMSYEDAMNMAVDLGGVGNTGGQKQLTPAEITRVMDRNVRRFLPCMAGQSVKKVQMDLAISGDGRMIGVSVKQGDAKLKKCVAAKVRSIKFPTSPSPRTAASWFFELY